MNAIEIFNWVRDVPYRVATDVRNPDYCCLTKPAMLQLMLKSAGIKARRRICVFRWKDLQLPKSLLKLSTRVEETHWYIEVFIPSKKSWVVVDPTWDRALKGTTWPIAQWNGKSATKLAVKPIKLFHRRNPHRW